MRKFTYAQAMKLSNKFDTEILSALLTWALVAGSSVYFLQRQIGWDHWRVPVAVLCYVLFIVLFMAVIRDKPYSRDKTIRWTLLLLLFVLVVGIYLLVPYSYGAILMVLLSAVVPHLLSFRAAVWLSPLWSLPLYLVLEFYWQEEYAGITSLLFWSFNLFALIMMNTAVKEQRARAEAEQKNRELLATQALLGQASKQAERTRISRNIHDLLGHHLTALSINLQVAQRKTEGEVRQLMEQSHGIAALLLSDVREAVSDMRQSSAINLDQALTLLTSEVPRLKVTLECNTQVADIEQANTILMCVRESLTNSLKHSDADKMFIRLDKESGQLNLNIRDNGGTTHFTAGNGLNGLRERVQALGGKVGYHVTDKSFSTHISLPEERP
ncbi:sensor histidine kinase [Lacimicrobium alkaliphilum]|uniref:Two-component sensor histidine kinase n=1 Tax=Lacimicrobium alkaliphilum TaxID=1526571 RepID=A0ABQ1QY68_9ALTE|nr:histidine kinase [Lacimicrobium alkaliphilum]GGD49407.1 two-component sensor histidine kinase [Lacimicrobium alkaliphilum]